MKIIKFSTENKEINLAFTMKNHTYQIRMEWQGNLGQGTKDYKAYSRDHIIGDAEKQTIIPGSSDPSFKGDKNKYNPEELLVSTVSSCHMLWYLHLCAVNKINVISYLDNASGVMEEFENGSGKFKSIKLSPEIEIKNSNDMLSLATDLHHKAHEMCFIANSVNFPISVEPHIKVMST